MIGRIRGEIIEKQAPLLLIDVNGIGYEVHAPMSTFYELPEVGQIVTLVTHLSVREDAHTLYGFMHDTERQLFRLLIRISGVGAKLALTILSGISANDFIQCIEDEDATTLTRLPGIGKKTAERLVMEMRDRLKDWYSEGSSEAKMATPGLVSRPVVPADDAVSALVSLGYKPAEAGKMIRALGDTADMGSEDIIREALRNSVKKN